MKILFALMTVLMVGCASQKVHHLPTSTAECQSEHPKMTDDMYGSRSYVYCPMGHSLEYYESGSLLTASCSCK